MPASNAHRASTNCIVLYSSTYIAPLQSCGLTEVLNQWFTITKCDAAQEKVPSRRNGVISMVVQRTYQGIKQNINHSKIHSTFRDIEF